MSTSSHKSDLRLLALLGILSAVILLALVGSGWLYKEEEVRWIRTSRSLNIEGTKICYTLLERLGYPVMRSEHPLMEATLQGVDILFLLDPILPIQGQERVEVEAWIRGGGVLVCSTGSGSWLSELHGLVVYLPEGDLSHELQEGGQSPRAENFTPVPEEALGLPLAREISSLSMESQRVISLEESLTAEGQGPMTELLRDRAGTRIAMRHVNSGKVIALADTSFLANGWIGKADNVIAAVNLVAYSLSQARGDRIAFDEYHLGYGRHETGAGTMGALLFKTSPGWAILSLTAAGLLFLLYKGRRFGSRHAPPRPQRRSKLEFVHSVGATYRSAGAYRLALELNFRWFKGRIAEKCGLPRTASSGSIAAALARRTGGEPGRYERFFREFEQALARVRLSGHRSSALIRKMAEIELEIFHGPSTGKRIGPPPAG